MRDLNNKQIRHCNIIPSDLPKWVFLEQQKRFLVKQKLFPNENNTPNTTKQLLHDTNAQKLQKQKPFQSFDNTGSRS